MKPDSTSEVIEEFTFRHGDRSVTTKAVIDSGAEMTQISFEIATQLGLTVERQLDLRLADGSRVIGHVYRCVVAWTIYEDQGYHCLQEVVCSRGGCVLIGFDFLRKHELSIDMHHLGLVGTAPENAIPLTGGGYVLNPPSGWVSEVNYRRAQAAEPGEILRPHPYWRFRVPAIQKRRGKQAPVDPG